MRPIALLDVDGVLNPRVVGDRLELGEARAALVVELAELAEIVWATTWSSAQTFPLGRELGISPDPESVTFPAVIDHTPTRPAPTPKLHWVARWLARSVDPDRAVVWIDDMLRADARHWADQQTRSLLLIHPDTSVGLTTEHLEEVRKFVSR